MLQMLQKDDKIMVHNIYKSKLNQEKLQQMLLYVLFFGQFSCFAGYSGATELRYTINEELTRGVRIGNLASDLSLDLSVTPPLQFSQASQGVNSMYVDLNNLTGELFTTVNQIDREELCPENVHVQECILPLDVIILPQQYFKLVKVKIGIKDINDNAPVFPVDEIHLSVSENAQINTRLAIEHSAVDPDIGINGVQTYWLENDYGVFTLDVEEHESGEMTPYLIVMGPLDREREDEYVTTIIAEDGGNPPLTGAASLRVSITDVNDNCPSFAESQINVTLSGNSTVGSRVAVVQAFDKDVGSNALIKYSYGDRVPVATKTMFRLDEATGIIELSGKIDGSTVQVHKLTILAYGPGCIPAVMTVIVSIAKVVFIPPMMIPRYIASESEGNVYLKESESANSPIAFFSIKDPDQQHKVVCYLESDGPFRLIAYKNVINEYLLETTEALDYEVKNVYDIVVVASDTAGLLLKTFIKVQVLDENDNAPVFNQQLVEVYLEENNAPNTFLAKLQAVDADSGERGAISYFLGMDAPSEFALNKSTGVLVASLSLDREKQEKYRFTVRAVDSGSPHLESEATVIVTVLDKNDNNPRFINKDFNFFVPENFPDLGEIGVIGVTDADASKNGWIALSISNGSDIFVIDSGKGTLRAKIPLDRELQSSYVLWVEAVDGGVPPLSSSAKVTVLLLDINDNPPIVLFPQSNMTYLLVLPSTLPGSSITEVYAVDNDTGMNAVIAYSIIGRKGPRPESFHIDSKTGNITLQEALLETDYGLYRLLVKVSDQGYPEPLHSTIMVNLFVNETVSNESYIENLLRREPEINLEEKQPQIYEEPQRKLIESFSCAPVVISLSVVTLSLFFLVILLTLYICSKKGNKHKHEEETLEVQVPLRANLDLHILEKKPVDITNI
ncbi:protocadherin-20 [Protopterus annectens]|uniref:protocadherin-20 n=1 Tax=Protopterus annectens TaxID=7888 RepID=UPI001CFA69BC|nr:protocadherin-20 [Protopterus annectens]